MTSGKSTPFIENRYFFEGYFSLALFVLLSSIPAKAVTEAKVWEIKSSADRFQVTQIGNSLQYSGKEIEDSRAQTFWSIINQNPKDTCPDLREGPDIVIKGKSNFGSGPQQFEIFSKLNLLKKDDRCLVLPKDIVLSTPLHRTWFTGKNYLNLPVRSRLRVQSDEVRFEFEYNEEWNIVGGAAAKQSYPNGILIQKLVNALQNFPIRNRWSLFAIKRWHLTVVDQSGSPYRIYEMWNGNMAIQFPGIAWLVETNDLAFIKDIEPESWFDPWSVDLKRLADGERPLSERVNVLRSLKRAGSVGVFRVCRDIARDKTSNDVLIIEASDVLISNPTKKNVKALVDLLMSAENMIVRQRMIKHLRAIFPAGPVIGPKDERGDVKEKLAQWQNWWSEYSTQ